ncbi:hypothetical protein AMELA_G00032330 [Ameiurus melas]|uniref:Uncharacterized protein n=1 Tax=Ameiurus melas TaxID=219545 RepID=A0A7J6B7M7_AMEME|nr:hypothetical protein AMELA_G00032330 [Ameiurus melas]
MSDQNSFLRSFFCAGWKGTLILYFVFLFNNDYLSGQRGPPWKQSVLWRDIHTRIVSNMHYGHGRPTLTPSCCCLHLLIPHHQREAPDLQCCMVNRNAFLGRRNFPQQSPRSVIVLGVKFLNED